MGKHEPRVGIRMESKMMARILRKIPGLAMCLTARDSMANAIAFVTVPVGSIKEN